MSVRNHHRAAGMGSVQLRARSNKVRVYGPQSGRERELIGEFDSRWAGERALSAWYVVKAVVMLAEMGKPCDSQLAS